MSEGKRKIIVQCVAMVSVGVELTDEQYAELESGEITLDQIIDESIPYEALSTDGTFEFTEWEEVM